MANMFNEDGTYNKTNWKAGDKITAGKLNKIEESLEAINNNDISRHVEADNRLDALEDAIEEYNVEAYNRLDALEEYNVEVEERLDALEDYNVKADNRLDALEEYNVEADNRLDALEVYNVVADNRLDALEEYNVEVEERLDALEDYNVEVEERLDALEDYNVEVEERFEELNDLMVDNKDELEKSSSYVTPEMFGAVGDGITDDTEAFVLAFKSGKNIICKKEKKYYFSNIINARSVTECVSFDGNYATFINFRLEIALKDEEYDWRNAYSPNRIDFKNCNFGLENDEREQSYNRPVVISGMTVMMSNIVLRGRLVLVAYPDRYIDVIHFYNVIKMNNETFLDDYEYNAVMRITLGGELVKTTSNGAGDSWLFIGCNEFRSHNINGEERYGLVSLYNNTATFIECIQSNMVMDSYTTTIFIGCHWEVSYPRIIENAANVLVKFDGCYFYGQTIPKAMSNIIFENCMFRLGYGLAFNYSGENSIIKNSQVINCRFCDRAGLIGNSSDLYADIGCNYRGDSFEEYGNSPSISVHTEKTEDSFTGETVITFYGKRLEANYYAFKTEVTLTLDGTQQIALRAFCKVPMIFEFFIQNNGKIYKGTTKTIDTIDTLEIHVFNMFFRANATYRKESINKCYPPVDTLEVVSSLPDYVENLTLYRLSKGLCIDASDNPVTNIPRFAVLRKENVGEGNMW